MSNWTGTMVGDAGKAMTSHPKAKVVKAWAMISPDGELRVETITTRKPNLKLPMTEAWVKMGAKPVRVEIKVLS